MEGPTSGVPSWRNRHPLDGRVDRISLPDGVTGALWLCGKHAIAPDPQRLIDDVGGTATVVCLVERHEVAERYPAYLAWLERPCPAAPTDRVWWPVPDLQAPRPDRALPFLDDLVRRLGEGATLVVHCGAGMGRAGTIAVCILIRLGVDVDDALADVAGARPGAGPEVGAQRDLVEAICR